MPLVGSVCLSKLFVPIEQEIWVFQIIKEYVQLKNKYIFKNNKVISTYYSITPLSVGTMTNALSTLTDGKNLHVA